MEKAYRRGSHPPGSDSLLFTPGPLTTSRRVKAAMLHDMGSRDARFVEIVAGIRRQLLRLANVGPRDHAAILLQGSGTYAVEAMIGSAVSSSGKLLVAINGAYGQRMVDIARAVGIPVTTLREREDRPIDPERIAFILSHDRQITDVAVVHCETTSGLVNPLIMIGDVVSRFSCRFLVDAMSSFGGIPVDLIECHVDHMASTANKCIEGVPGCSFVLSRRSALVPLGAGPRSVSLDLLAQLRTFDETGQFRFTPPTHVLLAFSEALKELEREGGIAGRARRYHSNHIRLMSGMTALGFVPYLSESLRSYIVSSFLSPTERRYSFRRLYDRLAERGFVIYPGKLAQVESFRVGTIGRLFPADMSRLLAATATALSQMGLNIPLRSRRRSAS